jgi:hypothetical protein
MKVLRIDGKAALVETGASKFPIWVGIEVLKWHGIKVEEV